MAGETAGAGPATLAAGAVPELRFAVLDAARLEHAAVPTLRFAVEIGCADGRDVRSILLDVQIQIAARRRAYDDADPGRLFELFGRPDDWGRNLRTLLWTRTTVVVPPFTGVTVAEVPVPCTYDLEVAASRYFDALPGGEVPLELLFSGTVFHTGPDGLLQVARIPLDQEADYRMPVAVWKETMDRHFPQSAWLRLGKERFDRLAAYRSRHALPSWDDAVDALLDGRDEVP